MAAAPSSGAPLPVSSGEKSRLAESLRSKSIEEGHRSSPPGGSPQPSRAWRLPRDASPRCRSSPPGGSPQPSRIKYLPCDASTCRSGVNPEKREKKSQSRRQKTRRPPPRILATRHTCHPPPRAASRMGRLEKYKYKGGKKGGDEGELWRQSNDPGRWSAPPSRSRRRIEPPHPEKDTDSSGRIEQSPLKEEAK